MRPMGAQPRDRPRVGRGRVPLPYVLLAVLLLGTGACSSAGTGSGANLRGTTVVLVAGWSGVEQARFERVLRRFTEHTGARVRYVSAAPASTCPTGSTR